MNDNDEAQPEETPSPGTLDERSWGDRLLDGPLSPKHKRVAELFAQGKSNKEIIDEMKMSPSWVSILKSNAKMLDEVERIRQRIYEDTIGNRLKKMAEPALVLLEDCLTDRDRNFKKSEQLDTAKWLVEKIDGKAAQKHDIGENMLGILMDRVDALRSSGVRTVTPHTTDIEMTPRPALEEAPPKPKTDENIMDEWVVDNI